jgi:serine/threonine-protein kinase
VDAEPALRAPGPRRALRPRQRLGKYQIERRIAEGSFADVYRALDTVEGVRVALKIPQSHLVDAVLLDAFRREVRLAAKLDHPNVLPLKNAQFVDGRFVVAYPLGQGTLGDRLRHRIAPARRAVYAAQMIDAVAHAHARGVVHCDLKPENFILFDGDRLRLTDFGISKVSRRTIPVSGSGTVGYVAPEQAMGRTSLRSDVFSLGLVLWELFSRELPEWPFRWPWAGYDRLEREAHPAFVALLRRAMAVDPADRFSDARAMSSAFHRLVARGQVLPPRPAPRRRPRRKVPTDWRRLRQRQFVRLYGGALQLRGECGRCHGPVSEAMHACPWCGHAPARYRGETAQPERCGRCGRGRRPDWRYCAHCFGPGFRRVSGHRFSDHSYTERCSNPQCERRTLPPFASYCPWCRRRVRRFAVPGAGHRCARCGRGVHAEFWAFCPWCAKDQRRAAPVRRR